MCVHIIICMYVCMNVCTYICMYVCIFNTGIINLHSNVCKRSGGYSLVHEYS